VLVGGVAVIGMLTGCVDPVPTPGATTSAATPSASGTPTATPQPTPTPSATATGTPATPIEADCATLVPLQALYDLDPNLALLDDAAPTGALALEAVAAGGVACTLVHTSNGSTIELAVSAPGSDALAAARLSAGDPLDLGIAGADGFASGSAVQAFTGTQRFSAESTGYDAAVLGAAIAIPLGAIG